MSRRLELSILPAFPIAVLSALLATAACSDRSGHPSHASGMTDAGAEAGGDGGAGRDGSGDHGGGAGGHGGVGAGGLPVSGGISGNAGGPSDDGGGGGSRAGGVGRGGVGGGHAGFGGAGATAGAGGAAGSAGQGGGGRGGPGGGAGGAGDVCSAPPPSGCCTIPGDCASNQGCVGSQCQWSPTGTSGPAFGRCLYAIVNEGPGSCWEDHNCPPTFVCVGARVCPCGSSCPYSDSPGSCQYR